MFRGGHQVFQVGQAPLVSPNSTTGVGSVLSSPSGVWGVFELPKHVWTHIANFGQSCMNNCTLLNPIHEQLSDASSFNMCNKLNSVHWALILVNYITLCTLHFCIIRFEGKVSDLIRLQSGGVRPPTPTSGGPEPRPPLKLRLCLHCCLLHSILEHDDILNTNISQGSNYALKVQ